MKKIFIIAVLILVSSVCFGWDITENEGVYTVKAEKYTACISDKLLFSLKNNEGAEMLSEELASWLQNTWAKVWTERKENSIICTKKDFGQAVYDFEEDRIIITIINDTPNTLCYSTVLSPIFESVISEEQKKYPVFSSNSEKISFTLGKFALTAKGKLKTTGPEGTGQLLEMFTEAGKREKIELVFGGVTKEQAKKAAELQEPILNFDKGQKISIYSPKDYQVFQRRTAAKGIALISGKVNTECDRIEYTVSGKNRLGKKVSEKTKTVSVLSDGSFNFETEIDSGGWYSLKITAFKGEDIAGENKIEHFGIGEVIVTAGQSNFTNRARERINTETGMVSATDGTFWKLCDDPMIGQHDSFEGRQGGSVYPALGDCLYNALKVPVAFASTGHGGTEAKAWLPGGELYNWFINRVRTLGKSGFRCVLWHQGEAERFSETSAEEYFNYLSLIINASVLDAGWYFPWFTAKASYLSPEMSSYEPVRKGQQMLWDKGVSLVGPDTDTLTGKYRDADGQGAHFAPQGLKAHALFWSYLLADYINKQL